MVFKKDINTNIDQSKNMPSRKILITLIVVIVVLLIVAVCEAFFLHAVNTKLVNTNGSLISTQQQLQTLQGNFSTEAALEGKDLLTKVGKLVQLPATEQPTIATVADLTKLQGQLFFVNAQIGDKILMYTTANQIILYRPSTNAIINSAALDKMNQQPPVNTSKISAKVKTVSHK